MMDGQVRAVRDVLDAHGHQDAAILGYAAKYASALYGPFREAVQSSLEGDRRTYQLDPANAREGVREAALDTEEGADIVMVKPASLYLDVLVARGRGIPRAGVGVSGERRVLDDRGGGRERLDRPRAGRARVARRRSAAPAPTRSSRTGPSRPRS